MPFLFTSFQGCEIPLDISSDINLYGLVKVMSATLVLKTECRVL